MWQGTKKVRKLYSSCFTQYVTPYLLNEKCFIRRLKIYCVTLTTLLVIFLSGRVQKSRGAGQKDEGDWGKDGARANKKPRLRRDQTGPLAAAAHSEERGYSQTVNRIVSPLFSALQCSPPQLYTNASPSLILHPTLCTGPRGRNGLPLNCASLFGLQTHRVTPWLLLSAQALRLSLGWPSTCHSKSYWHNLLFVSFVF